MDRKQTLTDAAIAIIGMEGLRGLTHRAVDQHAQLPSGTCSYHFPTRQAMLTAVVNRVAELSRADIERFSAGQLSPDIDSEALMNGAIATLTFWLGPARNRTRARMILELDPPSRALAGDTIDGAIAGFDTLITSVTGDLERAQLVSALIDGLLLDELTRGIIPVDPERLRNRLSSIVALTLTHQA